MGAYGSPELHPAITQRSGAESVRKDRGETTGSAQPTSNPWSSPPTPPPHPDPIPPPTYPPQPYPPQAYGVAPFTYPPGAPYPYQVSSGSNGVAIAAFVVGVIAIVLSWIPVLDIVLAAPAVILGGLGLSRANRNQGTGKGFAIAGLVLGAIAIVVTLAVFAVFVVIAKPPQ